MWFRLDVVDWQWFLGRTCAAEAAVFVRRPVVWRPIISIISSVFVVPRTAHERNAWNVPPQFFQLFLLYEHEKLDEGDVSHRRRRHKICNVDFDC